LGLGVRLMNRWVTATSLSLAAAAAVLANDLPVQKPDYHSTSKIELITSYIWANVPPGVPLPHETESAEKAGKEISDIYDKRLDEIADRMDNGGALDEIYAMKSMIVTSVQKTAATEAAIEQHYEDPGGCLLGDTRVRLASGGSRSLARLFEDGEACRTALARRSRVSIGSCARPLVTRGPFAGELVRLETRRASLGLTPNHEVVLASGEVVPAEALVPGARLAARTTLLDQLSRLALFFEERDTVVSVERRPYAGFVYNLVLDRHEDSFEAEGLPVLGLKAHR
jgi:hypothetical protein